MKAPLDTQKQQFDAMCQKIGLSPLEEPQPPAGPLFVGLNMAESEPEPEPESVPMRLADCKTDEDVNDWIEST